MNPLSITFKPTSLFFLLPVEPVSDSLRLPVGARGDIRCMRPSCGESRCTVVFVEVEKSLRWHVLFVFNGMSAATDQTATTAVCMLISSAFASYISLSSFSIKGSLKQSLSTASF